jgi:hypothetical protein
MTTVRVLSLAAVLLLSASLEAAAQAPPPEPTPPADAGALAACDAHWQRRAEGAEGAKAKAEEIDADVAACKKASEEAPDALEPRWKLMRGLYFKGEYTTSDPERQKAIFADGKEVGEDAVGLARRLASTKAGKSFADAGPLELAPVLKGDRDAAATFLWAAVDWGKWALVFGKSQAVKQGAAAKIRDYATAVVRMDPKFEEGGGYRVLGRLHHQTPSVPFLTGWASRGEALSNLKLAVENGPRNFINRLYLADALWDYEKSRRGEARTMLEALVKDTPSPDYPVEDRKAQEDARALLSQWTSK